MNIVVLMGRLCAEPELKHTNSGKAVTSFRLAVDRDKDKTDFFDIVAWEHTAEFVCKYFSKGSLIAIAGSLQTRHYTVKDGNTRIVTEVRADRASFTGERNEHN